MKLYLVAPVLPANSDDAAIEIGLRRCIQPIADLILPHIATDPALFGMGHEGHAPTRPIRFETVYGCEELARIANTKELREILVDCGDPSSGRWMLIRSLITCRAVNYGYDGQAFVCLPTDTAPIISPDEAMISVEECSHLLSESDWMDGLTNAINPPIDNDQ